jgi:hypothetical protein
VKRERYVLHRNVAMISADLWSTTIGIFRHDHRPQIRSPSHPFSLTTVPDPEPSPQPLEDHYYDRMTCQVHIDGQRCGSIWATQNPYTLESTRVDASRVREWVFAQPVRSSLSPSKEISLIRWRLQRLDEDDAAPRGPAQPDLGAITVTARRARAGASVMAGNYYKVQDAGSISEKTKKGILGAVTAYVLPHRTTKPRSAD